MSYWNKDFSSDAIVCNLDSTAQQVAAIGVANEGGWLSMEAGRDGEDIIREQRGVEADL